MRTDAKNATMNPGHMFNSDVIIVLRDGVAVSRVFMSAEVSDWC